MSDSICELVRKAEQDYTKGTTQQSKYVSFQMHDTLEQIEAYLNSKHISGEQDSQGRDKPFFNIVTAAVNIWYRATDIDRKNIKVRATKSEDWIDSFLATVLLRDWMIRERFGQFLNEWGRSLARYGSSVIKFVRNSQGLHISIVPWSAMIVDQVDFDASPKIEVIELTEAQLRKRIRTQKYDKAQVDALCNALKARETLDRRKKDNKNEYIKLYEVHGELSQAIYKRSKGEEPDEEDEDIYFQQMHVVAFVGTRSGRQTDYEDFTLYSGKESVDPYMITHLIKEDDRTLSIGAVEHLFQAQWMTNHSMKSIKDTLDLSSKLVFQTADANFVGKNVLDNIMDGDILIHASGLNMNLTKVENSKPDVQSWQNFSSTWKALGNEVTGVSEAMLGSSPKSGTAWRQTNALLQESYSLFELMTENKGLQIEDMLRERILPYLREKLLNNTKEIAATLEAHEISRIDSIYVKKKALEMTNKQVLDKIFNHETVSPQDQAVMGMQNEQSVQASLDQMGAQRFFKPSDLSKRTWKEQLKDLEWEVEVDVTGESFDTKEALTTLNTALSLVVQPGFAQNKKAQMIVGRILEISGTMSPLEYYSMPDDAPPVPVAAAPAAQPDTQPALPS